MIVGLCRVEIFVPDGDSLKRKRQVLSSLKTRLHNTWNVSVAEVEDQELWQRAVLGLACVGNETGHVNRVLDQALNFIRSHPSLEILQSRIELL